MSKRKDGEQEEADHDEIFGRRDVNFIEGRSVRA
jgi:hypothetical protein